MVRLPLLFPLIIALASCGGAKTVTEATVPRQSPTTALTKGQRADLTAMFLDATNARLANDPVKAMGLYQATIKADPGNAAAMFELAKLYHQAQHGDEALALAKKAVANDKTNIWYRFLLADLSTQMGDMEGAAKAYKGILAQWPDRYEVYFGLADVLARQGKLDQAQQVFRDLGSRFGSSDELVMREYEMLVDANQVGKAKDLLERTIAEHPDDTQYFGVLAEVYAELGQVDKALEFYKKALAADPDDSMTRISLAQYYYGRGDHESGFQQLREAFSDPDLDIDPKMQLLLGFYQMSDTSGEDTLMPDLITQSHELIQVMKKAHPGSGKPFSIEGDFFMREGKYPEAREAFRSALVYEQDKFPIWNALLQLDLQLSDWSALHEDAVKAVELFPTQPGLQLYDGIALSQLKRYDDAILSLLTGRSLMVDNKPLEAQFWSALGDAYHQNKQYTLSDDAFGHALAINDKDPSTLNNWAYYLSERGDDLAKAEQMSRKSNELAPGVSTYMDTYAWVLYKEGKFDQARSWQEKALAATAEPDGLLLEHYGDILYKLGEVKDAVEQWKKAQLAGGASEDIDRKIKDGGSME